jgi:ABC-type phosphate transport system substrate-binding protein
MAVKRSVVAAFAAFAALIAFVPGTAFAAQTPDAGFATIIGSGSSWQSVAILQWAADLTNGLTVNYLPDGSAAGRADYMQGSQVDFAASDVPFRDGTDKLGGTGAEVPPYSYSYLPLVAGGIAIVYNLTVNGRQVTGLQLSQASLLGIFTGQITNWDDARITRDNNGHRLPSLRIRPVVHGDPAGSTFYFTDWMAHRFPRQWNAFCARVTRGRVKPPCGHTEFYPAHGPGWHPVVANGSNAVMITVTSATGNGTIAYDENAYAVNANWPVARIANAAGKYVLPAALNVTRALTRAVVNENPRSKHYLEENLANVYTYKNPASYPLSYYGYVIVPRAGGKIPPIFNNKEGRSLSTYLIFASCGTEQLRLPELGYAFLPRGLTAVALKVITMIPGHVGVPRLSACRGHLPD